LGIAKWFFAQPARFRGVEGMRRGSGEEADGEPDGGGACEIEGDACADHAREWDEASAVGHGVWACGDREHEAEAAGEADGEGDGALGETG
jgi:hypothetical protein